MSLMSLKPREEREANLQDEIVEEFHGGKFPLSHALVSARSSLCPRSLPQMRSNHHLLG